MPGQAATILDVETKETNAGVKIAATPVTRAQVCPSILTNASVPSATTVTTPAAAYPSGKRITISSPKGSKSAMTPVSSGPFIQIRVTKTSSPAPPETVSPRPRINKSLPAPPSSVSGSGATVTPKTGTGGRASIACTSPQHGGHRPAQTSTAIHGLPSRMRRHTRASVLEEPVAPPCPKRAKKREHTEPRPMPDTTPPAIMTRGDIQRAARLSVAPMMDWGDAAKVIRNQLVVVALEFL